MFKRTTSAKQRSISRIPARRSPANRRFKVSPQMERQRSARRGVGYPGHFFSFGNNEMGGNRVRDLPRRLALGSPFRLRWPPGKTPQLLSSGKSVGLVPRPPAQRCSDSDTQAPRDQGTACLQGQQRGSSVSELRQRSRPGHRTRASPFSWFGRSPTDKTVAWVGYPSFYFG